MENFLTKGVPIVLGSRVAVVYGGPFKNFVPGTRRLAGIKMAAEIDHPHTISVPTADYSTPSVDSLTGGLMAGLEFIDKGYDLYAGCMGGIGRTGLYMAVMVKVMNAINEKSVGDPVAYVRQHYHPHAVETPQQRKFVADFPVEELVLYWENLHPVKVVEVISERVMSPWEWAMRWLG